MTAMALYLRHYPIYRLPYLEARYFLFGAYVHIKPNSLTALMRKSTRR